jgi:uncharacterized membrane protein
MKLDFDLGAFLVSVALVSGYHLFLAVTVRRNPFYTVHSANVIARRAWVEHVMSDPSREIMAVQTLRNSIMAASFLGSTAVLLMMGTLTLISQSSHVSESWHVLSLSGADYPELWIAKVLLLLLAFIVAFFSFAMVVRLLNHVLYMVNVPAAKRTHPALQPEQVAGRLNRSGFYYTVGMRAYYIAVPLVFWLFGPPFLLAASVVLVAVLYRLDRGPGAQAPRPDDPGMR